MADERLLFSRAASSEAMRSGLVTQRARDLLEARPEDVLKVDARSSMAYDDRVLFQC
jgi:hypothetical protein